jgi:hypothetical protein
LDKSLIKAEFQNFFYFWALNSVVGVECLHIFQQSVSSELYEWLLKKQRRRKARSVQDVIRRILREAKAEVDKHG